MTIGIAAFKPRGLRPLPKTSRSDSACSTSSRSSPFLAWVGLGADGLSSSAYGPEEAFSALGEHTGLAVFLALATAHHRLHHQLRLQPHHRAVPPGGGGYVVATKLLGKRVGVVSGARAARRLRPHDHHLDRLRRRRHLQLPAAVEWHGARSCRSRSSSSLLLTVLNLRGVKESVTACARSSCSSSSPTSIAASSAASSAPRRRARGRRRARRRAAASTAGSRRSASAGCCCSSSAPTRSAAAPTPASRRSRTAWRSCASRGCRPASARWSHGDSLAFTAGGPARLLPAACTSRPAEGKTMNAVCSSAVAGSLARSGARFVVVTLLTEGALLFVAAQAGFLDGPRVMANMAIDSWLPHRFAALSERLTMHNGILLMGGAVARRAALHRAATSAHSSSCTRINVFLTFSLSMLGDAALLLARRQRGRRAVAQPALLFAIGFLLCATILVITVVEKFREGGWLTLVVTRRSSSAAASSSAGTTAPCAASCELPRCSSSMDLPQPSAARRRSRSPNRTRRPPRSWSPSYGGLGVHTLLNIFRGVPGLLQQRGLRVGRRHRLAANSRARTRSRPCEPAPRTTLEQLRAPSPAARACRLPHRMAIGTDAVAEARGAVPRGRRRSSRARSSSPAR